MSNTDKSDGPDDEPKLVVDTDWKEQVAREKEQAQESAKTDDSASDGAESAAAGSESGAGEVTPSEEADSTVAADSGDGAAGSGDGEVPPPPPASFEVLVSMLFTQAMAMLGHMPDPSTGQSTVNKPYAKHTIDTLEMLGEKTKGNLSDGESKVLSEALHALRMMYVSAGK